ncbi:hypothetical protein AVB85_02065 [Salmonella enterica subsp. enterica serovar Vitkin]|uniref:Uncharacterized protein n=2 Tax=Salmonella enterica TaxID=28901 RepID=A0A750FL34_SALER|nr:hypothetical protein [Salmonella enterica]EBS1712639.1 hypothetical protein [Salmonella enterica subsp. enterica serovar Vitkin]ECC1609078.1 hypothetical protein [Salmonella enterica subsp. salamae]ECP4590000.1 hypothetical protein [Salmonella enterica subsp. enterica serovar Muenchen]EDG9410578.1 hypothetical protein [Salmonella enterica subsp. enterica serovar Tennessee]EDL3628096.1 hypothetical protein [Salmonella enterica subsp. enterica serovar Newport]EDV6084956.1 hypothetical protei
MQNKECERVKAILASSLTNTFPGVVEACIDKGASLGEFRATKAVLVKQLPGDNPYDGLISVAAIA